MNKTDLQTLLTARYQRDNWKALLLGVFHDNGAKVTFDENPVEVLLSTKAAEYRTTNLFRIGDLQLADGKTIALFEAEVQNTRIAKNRVGLRNLVAKEIVPYFQDGAFAVFHSKDEREWRFSFITKYEEWDTQTGLLQKVETAPKRYTYLCGSPHETFRTAIGRLLKLQESPKTLQDIFDAFSVAKLSKEFFDEYKKRYEGFCAYLYAAADPRKTVFGLTGGEDEPTRLRKEKAIRDFVKKMLGRLVFLHFVQKKGWMGVPADSAEGDWSGGDANFLQRLFLEAPQPQHFHSQILERLFYQTLNTRRPADRFEAPWGKVKVPYLNGGLYDNDFPKGNGVDFPPEKFADLFQFFNQYNFTIDENRGDEHEVGIDPEMLGHIFENLLEDNKDKGAYYTPKEVVHYMCRESLLQYLKTQTPDAPPGFMEELVRQKTLDDRGWLLRLRSGSTNGERLEALLDAVKICDPAIGSGAFPMGMLHEIFDLKLLLDATLNPAKTKQQIIQHSIYGVDIDRGAVDIARLRFWLSLVVDEDQPQPLPNLDYKIMQGNSLLESYNGIPLDKIVADERMGIRLIGQGDLFLAPQIAINFEGEETLEDLERQYFDADDPAKKSRCKKKIDEKVLHHLDKSLEGKANEFFIHIEQAKANRDKLVQGLQGAQLEKAATSAAYRKAQQQVDQLIGGLDRLEASRSQLHEEYCKDERNFFLWHLYFKPVFEQGGFDIAIGNPPYVQIQKLPAAAKAALEAEGFDTFAKTADLYCLFYEKALRILRPGGVLAFITSNSWLKTQYGEPLRHHFTTQADPLALLNFEDTQIFKAAIVETNILLAQKGDFHDHLRAVALGKDYLPGQPLAAYLDEKGTTVSGLSGEAWHIGDAKTVALKAKLEGEWKRLKDWDVTINFGIKTGFNKAFILSDDDLKKLPINDSKLIKPILRGRDIEKYGIHDQQHWLLFTSNGYLFSKEEQKYSVYKKDNETYFKKGGQEFKVFREEPRSKNSKRFNRVIVAEDYPDLVPHFEKYEAEMRNREDQGDHWTNLRNCDYGFAFELPKIMWGEISDEPKFTYDEQGYFMNNTMFFMVGKKLKFLLAIFNSKVGEWYFNEISTTSGMGTNRWFKYKIELLPIAAASEAAEEQITALVDNILGGKKAGHDTAALEAAVDVLVFKLYGLGYEEAAAIAPGLDAGLWEEVGLGSS